MVRAEPQATGDTAETAEADTGDETETADVADDETEAEDAPGQGDPSTLGAEKAAPAEAPPDGMRRSRLLTRRRQSRSPTTVGGEIYVGPEGTLLGLIDEQLSAGYAELRCSF